jgi:pyrroline-5-carboxylate reductase
MKGITSLGFIGGGRVTRLLLYGLKNKDALPERILVSDPDPEVLEKVQMVAPQTIECHTDNKQVVNAELIFLAVHPPVVREVCEQIAATVSGQVLIISLAPVLPMQKLAALLNGHERLARMIPNAPSVVNAGYNPVAFSPVVEAGEKQQLLALFADLGETVEVEETTLEAYAILTAMGPTYFWSQWQALRRLGVDFGLPEHEVNRALAAMLHGSVDTLFEPDLQDEEVFDLIPVKPMKPYENDFNEKLTGTLTQLYKKLTGK